MPLLAHQNIKQYKAEFDLPILAYQKRNRQDLFLLSFKGTLSQFCVTVHAVTVLL